MPCSILAPLKAVQFLEMNTFHLLIDVLTAAWQQTGQHEMPVYNISWKDHFPRNFEGKFAETQPCCQHVLRFPRKPKQSIDRYSRSKIAVRGNKDRLKLKTLFPFSSFLVSLISETVLQLYFPHSIFSSVVLTRRNDSLIALGDQKDNVRL